MTNKNKLEKLEAAYGAVEIEGNEYFLTQHPYIYGTQGEKPHYRAAAIDNNGDEYLVTWNVLENWEIIEDESDMCDWDNPCNVEKI